jgi:uncharacterized protein involved in exopolysaccharide biosynthesis/Mrp family chromosome partitioning ATPase
VRPGVRPFEWKPESMPVDNPPSNQAAPEQRPPAAHPSPGFSLFALSALLWRRKAEIALSALIFAAATVAVGKCLTPKYMATAQVYVDAHQSQPADDETEPRSQDGSDLAMAIESQARMITSNSVLLQVIQDTQLDKDPEFRGAAAGDAAQATALETLRRHIVVTRPDHSFIVNIEVWSTRPAKAAMLANAIANAYVAETGKWHALAARRATANLSDRLKALQERLRRAEDALAAYKMQNNLGDGDDGQISDQQLSASAQRLAAARAATLNAQAKYDRIEAGLQDPTDAEIIPETLQSPTLARLYAQYEKARRRYAELTGELGPEHPALRQMESQVEDLRRAIKEEVEQMAESATNDLARARDYEASLNQTLEAQKRQRAQFSQTSGRLRELESNAEVSRDVYQSFLERTRQAEDQQSLDTSRAHVINDSTVPLPRTFPPAMSLLAGIGFLLGALAAAVWLAAADRLLPETGEMRPAEPETATVASPSIQPPEYLPQPEAAVSAIEKPLIARLQESEVVRTQSSVLTVGALPDLTRIGWPTLRIGAPVKTFLKTVEEMRAAVMRRPSSGAIPVMAVIGAGASEDRSIAALNVALAAARSGSRVLLIDADRTSRALSNQLHGPGKHRSGRFGWLGIGTKAAFAIETANGISVLPVNRWSDTRVSEVICKAIAEVRSLGGYDLVILDGPASPWSAADRRLLDIADALLASLPVNLDINDCVREMIAALGDTEHKLIGFILNELHPAAVDTRRDRQLA